LIQTLIVDGPLRRGQLKRDKKAADRLVDEAVEEVGLQTIALAVSLLGYVPDDTASAAIHAVPFLQERYYDPLRFG
jgi:hypothetical protein